jgi:hypothetical protein
MTTNTEYELPLADQKFLAITKFQNRSKYFTTSDIPLVAKEYKELPLELQEDMDVIYAFVEMHFEFFKELPQHIQKDKNVVITLINTKKLFSVYKYIPENLKRDHEIIQTLLETKYSDALNMIFSANPLLETNKPFLLKAVKINGELYKGIHEFYREDIELTTEAVKNSAKALCYLPKKFREHPEKWVALNFFNFISLEFSIPISINTLDNLNEIKKNIQQNNDVEFNMFVEKEMVTHYWPDMERMMTRECNNLPSIHKNYAVEFNRYLSYMMKYWKVESIQYLLDKSNEIVNDSLKNSMSAIFSQELKRRDIINLNQDNNQNKAKTKPRKIKF